MSTKAGVCLVAAILSASAAIAQTDDWLVHYQKGQALEGEANYAGALASYEASAKLLDGAAATDPRRLLAWNSVASMHDALGRYADAERSYRRAMTAAAESRGKSSAEYAVILGSLGSLYIEMGQSERGESMLRESIALQEASEDPMATRIALGRVCLAEALLASGKYREPEELLIAALAVWEKKPEAWRERSLILNNLGVVDLYQKRFSQAQPLFERSLAMMESGFGPDHPMLVRVLNNLASLFSRTGRREEATQYLRRALGIVEKYLGVDHPVNGILLRNYAALVRESGDKATARTLEAKSDQVLKQSALRSGMGMLVDISALPRK